MTILTFIRLPEVMAAVGMSRTTIYERMKAGTFPQPYQLGARAVAWDVAEVAAWQQALARGVKESYI